MKIEKYILGELQANCYLLIDKENNCLIIDPADEGGFLLEEVQRKRLKPQAILVTHGHFDHLLAAGEVQKSINIPLYISKKDLFLLERLEDKAAYFLGYRPAVLPIKNIKDFDIESSLKINNWKLKIIKTPGHTLGSVSYYFKKEKVLFSGDTLFKNGIGRYDFSYSSKNNLIKSLKKIISLPEDVIVCPGHGEKTTIKSAKKYLWQVVFFKS